MTASVDSLRKAKLLGPLDEHCARTLCRIAGETGPDVLLAAAIAVRQVGLGQVCADLPALAAAGRLAGEDGVTLHEVAWPALDGWLEALRASALVDEPINSDARRPLVLDAAGRLYLRRYYEHEQRLAASLLERAGTVQQIDDAAALDAMLSRLFARADEAAAGATPSTATQSLATVAARPTRGTRGARAVPGQLDLGFAATPPAPVAVSQPASAIAPPDEQRDAARTAATRRLCVISGGPGTGKTSTVVKILALLAELRLHAGQRPPRVLLLAPTGKAAMRLTEAIRRAKSGLACDEAVRAAIPEEASTIHRALGSVAGSGTRFRHHREHPLRADVVLVDEASMVDLALMSRLVDAVPVDARLILLGDKDQLASVEAGAVLGELCGPVGEPPADTGGALASSIVQLTRSYRYRAGSGIEALASAINAGDAAAAIEILAEDRFADVARRDPAPSSALSGELAADALAGGRSYLASDDARARLLALEGFRVLCAHRQGPHGVANANAEIEALLAAERLIDRRVGPTYAGRPIMITRNDYQLHLFNGDVGTIVARDGKQLAFFVAPDGEERLFSPARLPPHETVFAMTIHKSQGSEFDRVAVLLGERSSPLLTRELLYTAVTRARRQVTLYATEQVLAEAIARRTERGSGLRDALRGAR